MHKRTVLGMLGALALLLLAPLAISNAQDSEKGSFKIGIMHDLTGPTGPYGTPQQRGAELAAEVFNESGGWNGRKVEVNTIDLGSQNGGTPIAVRKLVESGVVAIQGPTGSTPFQLAAPVAAELKVVVVCPGCTNSFGPNVLNQYTKRLAPIAGTAWPFLMERMLEASGKPKRIAAFYTTKNIAAAQEISLLKENASKFGYEVVDVQSSPEGQTNLTNVVSNIAASNPDAIYIAHLVSESAAFMKQVRERGINVPFVGAATFASTQLFELAGAAGEGSFAGVPFLDSPTAPPAVKKFVTDFRAKYGTAPDAYAAEGYDAMMATLAAIVRANSTDTTKIEEAFHGLTFEGVTGAVTYEDGPENITARYIPVKWESGRFVAIK